MYVSANLFSRPNLVIKLPHQLVIKLASQGVHRQEILRLPCILILLLLLLLRLGLRVIFSTSQGHIQLESGVG